MNRYLVALISIPLVAHDLWMVPATFAPAQGQIVGIRLLVGQNLLGDPLPRSSPLINQFVVADAEGVKPVVGRDGGDPAGLVRAAGPGMMVVGYRSNGSPVELPAEKFNAYLKEEGLEAVIALRAKRNQNAEKGREMFYRCAKSLLLSGAASEAQADRRLGFPLELVAERNPYLLRTGDLLPVRLTYENKPLAGALVIAMNRQNPSEKVALRTGKDGRVQFKLRPGGMWLIKAVHMIPAPAGVDADWASFWASLTFDPKFAAAEISKR